MATILTHCNWSNVLQTLEANTVAEVVSVEICSNPLRRPVKWYQTSSLEFKIVSFLSLLRQ